MSRFLLRTRPHTAFRVARNVADRPSHANVTMPGRTAATLLAHRSASPVRSARCRRVSRQPQYRFMHASRTHPLPSLRSCLQRSSARACGGRPQLAGVPQAGGRLRRETFGNQLSRIAEEHYADVEASACCRGARHGGERTGTAVGPDAGEVLGGRRLLQYRDVFAVDSLPVRDRAERLTRPLRCRRQPRPISRWLAFKPRARG